MLGRGGGGEACDQLDILVALGASYKARRWPIATSNSLGISYVRQYNAKCVMAIVPRLCAGSAYNGKCGIGNDMRIEPESDEAGIVIVGSFNPRIFQPFWLAKQNLISDEAAENAKITIIHPDITAFEIEPYLACAWSVSAL